MNRAIRKSVIYLIGGIITVGGFALLYYIIMLFMGGALLKGIGVAP